MVCCVFFPWRAAGVSGRILPELLKGDSATSGSMITHLSKGQNRFVSRRSVEV